MHLGHQDIALVLLWAFSAYFWWGATWGGHAERTWELTEGYCERVAQVFGGSWSRDDEIRLARFSSTVLLVLMTIVVGHLLWRGLS